jgi:dual specificity phosphatase 12
MNKVIIIIIIILVLFLIRCVYYYPRLYNNTKNLGYKLYNKLCDFKLIPNQNLIEPNLWLGDFRSSLDKNFIKRNDIKLIVNLSKNLNFVDLENVEKYRVPIHDNRSHESDVGMISHFPEVYKKIDSYLKDNKGVLVHCRAGMQRSATIVALYLMKKRNLDFENAKKFIRSKRCIAFYPVVNFYGPIKYFESKF